jgi:hypothetical protein
MSSPNPALALKKMELKYSFNQLKATISVQRATESAFVITYNDTENRPAPFPVREAITNAFKALEKTYELKDAGRQQDHGLLFNGMPMMHARAAQRQPRLMPQPLNKPSPSLNAAKKSPAIMVEHSVASAARGLSFFNQAKAQVKSFFGKAPAIMPEAESAKVAQRHTAKAA